MGLEAYRPNFCIRALTIEFMYIWVTMVIIETLVIPAVRLAAALPRVMALQAKLFGQPNRPDFHEETIQEAAKIQEELSACFLMILTAIVFGIGAPVLPIIALAGCWSNICSLVWVKRTTNRMPFAQTLAATILVQPPVFIFHSVAVSGNIFLSCFVFIDLQFGLSPVLGFMFASGIVIILSFVRSNGWVQLCQRINDKLDRIIEVVLPQGAIAVQSQSLQDGEMNIDVNPISTVVLLDANCDAQPKLELPQVTTQFPKRLD